MWHAKVAEDQWASLQGAPKRQLCKADCGSPAQPFTLADQHDTDPLAGSEWRAQFQLVQRLSAGTYGFVWRCLDRASEHNLAIKFIARDKNTIDKNVEREIINHSGLMHPHIIEFKICFLTGKYLAIAMEYADGEDLLRLVNRKQGLPEDEARWLYQQLILAVDYTHRMGIVNRDIKLDNILLEYPVHLKGKPFLKMCDFGYSINQNHSLPVTAVGTPGYTAPEILQNVKKRYDGTRSDVWSAGVVLFAMLFCQYPFDRRHGDPPPHSSDYQILFIQRLKAADIMLPAHTPISPLCKDLMRKIFNPCPEQRITIQQIQQHPWFTQNLPAPMQGRDWNDQYVQHVDATARADMIKQTVHRAVEEHCPLTHGSSAPAFVSASGNSGHIDRGHIDASHFHNLNISQA